MDPDPMYINRGSLIKVFDVCSSVFLGCEILLHHLFFLWFAFHCNHNLEIPFISPTSPLCLKPILR